MSSYVIFFFFITLLNGLIVWLALHNNPRGKPNQYFSFLVVSAMAWMTASFLEGEPNARNYIHLLVKIDFFSAIPLAYFFYKFCVNFPRPWLSLPRKVDLVVTAVSFLALLIAPSSLVVKGVHVLPGGIDVVPGGFYFIYSIIMVGLILSSLIILFQRLVGSVGKEKQQLFCIFIGLLLSGVTALVTNLILPRLFEQEIFISFVPRLGIYSVIFFTLLTLYAILKHRFMDIRVAVRAILFRFLVILLLSSAFVGAISIYRRLPVEPDKAQVYLTLGALGMAFLVAIFYRPLELFLKSVTDKLFFQREYSYQELLRNLGKTMAQSVDLEEILNHLEGTLKEVMKVNYVGFVLTQEKQEITQEKSLRQDFGELSRAAQGEQEGEGSQKSGLMVRGFEEGTKYQWAVDDLLLQQIRFKPEVIVTDELARELTQMPDTPVRMRSEQLVDELKKMSAGVVVPLPSKEGVIGVMLLGEKKSLDAFTVQDIQVLESLMYQAGISIENAALFAEVKDFNIKLRQEITIATKNLAIKNKNLTVLRKLDQIIINTLEFNDMGQKISDVVTWEMGYLNALVCYLDKKENRLRALAVANTPAREKIKKILSQDILNYSLDMDLDPSNLLVRAIKERKPFYSPNLADFLTPVLGKKVVQQIQEVDQIKHYVCFCLSSKGNVLGAVLIGLPLAYDDFGPAEKELIIGFVEEAGIALENAKMYSDLKNLNLQLEKMNERLKELDTMKDELVSIASHDLRAPMNSIKSHVFMALFKQRDNISDKVAGYLERAYQSSEQMLRLINDMLSVSRLDSGHLEVNAKAHDWRPLVENVMQDMQMTAKEKGVKFKSEIPDDLPQVWVDHDRISEVLFNLMSNAFKFSFPNGEIEIVVEPPKDGFVKTWIIDHGPGISQEDQKRLFRKFGRLQHSYSTMAENQGGTGLGLYISQGLVNLHGGAIGVESEEGKGTRFHFTLRVVGES
ncbi:hypothetical protein KKB83_05580 [Patescibacteria group bacterium]|nr:hypothetical protein [Patescibacteria group bacterium]